MVHKRPCWVALARRWTLVSRVSMPRRARCASRFASMLSTSKRLTADDVSSAGEPPRTSDAVVAPAARTPLISASGTYSASFWSVRLKAHVVRFERPCDSLVVHDGVEARGAFHGRDVLEQQLRELAQDNAVAHEHVVRARDLAELDASVDERRRQRQDDQEQRRRQQATQRLRADRCHWPMVTVRPSVGAGGVSPRRAPWRRYRPGPRDAASSAACPGCGGRQR